MNNKLFISHKNTHFYQEKLFRILNKLHLLFLFN